MVEWPRLMRSIVWASAMCGVWQVTSQDVSNELSMSRLLRTWQRVRSNEEGLPDDGEQEVVVERRSGPDVALFPASVSG